MKFFPQSEFYVNDICENFQSQKSYTQKDIQNLPTCIAVRNHFNIANFDTLLKGYIFFINHENFGMRPFLC